MVDVYMQGVHHNVLCDNNNNYINSQICSVTPTDNHDVSTVLPVGAVTVVRNKSVQSQGSLCPRIPTDINLLEFSKLANRKNKKWNDCVKSATAPRDWF